MRLDIDRLKAAVPPADFYRRELGLFAPGPAAWVDGGLCPFHSDTRAGSLRVNVVTGSFRCFSCGAKGGDVIAFVRLRDDVSFIDAARYVARVGGVEYGSLT